MMYPLPSQRLTAPYPSTKSDELSPVEEADISEEMIVSEMIDRDFIVQMPPVNKYTIQVKIKGIKKASPRVVEPEEVLYIPESGGL